jgi:hypothetical protein
MKKQKKRKQRAPATPSEGITGHPPSEGITKVGRKPIDPSMRRVSVTGSCSAATGEQMRAWVKSRCNIKPMSHVGHVLDAMRAHCQETNFNPTK